VIAPSLGPIDEVVQDKQTGLLFRAGDGAHLAQQVAWALSHEEQLQSMGRRARAKYESTYNGDKNYARLMEIYERVLAGKVQQAVLLGTLDKTHYQASRVASA
jgi:glycosyltransferase involved in cell wall biosynthesis